MKLKNVVLIALTVLSGSGVVAHAGEWVMDPQSPTSVPTVEVAALNGTGTAQLDPGQSSPTPDRVYNWLPAHLGDAAIDAKVEFYFFHPSVAIAAQWRLLPIWEM